MPVRLSLSHYRAVLFDVDGTLVDTQDGVICGIGDAIVRYFGFRPRDEEIRNLIGRPIRAQFQHFAGHDLDPGQLDEMAAYTIDRFEHHKDKERVFEPAVAALRRCHESGRKVALVTSKSARELELFLSRFTGADVVDAYVSSSDVQTPKPDPECALAACQRLSVSPREAVFIGDSVYDVRCAHDAGMPAVAVSYGSASSDALSVEQPEVLLQTPEALLDWVQASLAQSPCPERSQNPQP